MKGQDHLCWLVWMLKCWHLVAIWLPCAGIRKNVHKDPGEILIKTSCVETLNFKTLNCLCDGPELNSHVLLVRPDDDQHCLLWPVGRRGGGAFLDFYRRILTDVHFNAPYSSSSVMVGLYCFSICQMCGFVVTGFVDVLLLLSDQSLFSLSFLYHTRSLSYHSQRCIRQDVELQ